MPFATLGLAPIVEPFVPLSGGRFVRGHGVTANPDPLRDYVWNLTAMPGPNTSLQLIEVRPTAAAAVPDAAFSGIGWLVGNASSADGVARALGGGGTLRVDFGVELAAWLELRSRDLSPAAVAAGCVTMSVGESTTPKYFAYVARFLNRILHSRMPLVLTSAYRLAL
jgi:hypothetical protein